MECAFKSIQHCKTKDNKKIGGHLSSPSEVEGQSPCKLTLFGSLLEELIWGTNLQL